MGYYWYIDTDGAIQAEGTEPDLGAATSALLNAYDAVRAAHPQTPIHFEIIGPPRRPPPA